MIDALRPDSLVPQDAGLRANIGPWSFFLECSHLDSEALLQDPNQQVFTVLEIEGERMAKTILLAFATRKRRDLYLILRELKGIGRRSALAILDTGQTLDILRAVAAKDSSLFQVIPGLGEKRLAALFETLETAYAGALPKTLPIEVALWVEVREALRGNGLSFEEAEDLLSNSSLQGNAEELYREIKEKL